MRVPAAGTPNHDSIRVFVSFDLEHDLRLYGRLLEQSRIASSGFEVRGKSEHLAETGVWDSKVREQIAEVDQVVVICGEHTEGSRGVCAEFRIAQEERTPCSLLWGRRDIMCTKPMGATPSDSMYSWTPEILWDRLSYMRRTDGMDEIPCHAPEP